MSKWAEENARNRSQAAKMSFSKLPRSNNITTAAATAAATSSSSEAESRSFEAPTVRPRFDSTKTSHRLREGLPTQLPSFSMSSIRKGRRSIFKELGLGDGHEYENDPHYREQSAVTRRITQQEFNEITGLGFEQHASPHGRRTRRDSSDDEGGDEPRTRLGWLSKLSPKRPKIKSAAGAPPSAVSGLHRLSMIALLIAVFIPAISYRHGYEKVEISGADAGVIPTTRPEIVLDSRADSPVDVCLRWAHQSAMVNGTIYIYGGQAKTEGGQKQNTWKGIDNNLLILDTTKSWKISSPSMTGLPKPSGPPAVSLGYLWNDYNNLFLYGGEFADNPYTEPEPYSTWKYDITAKSWTEYNNPKTSAGNASEPEGIPIQRAGEGAGVSVPELGRSWYFGGHLDLATTQGWSNQIDRVYLKGLLEFTHPGYANNGVNSLRAAGAGEGGAYRNITEGGIQDSTGFTERADGQLVFVPGWGPSGILLGLGGGSTANKDSTAEFASMKTIDVYDIESSVWYHQETRGEAPGVRVNPCAVVFSAPDASSFNIYLYGGQNLLPTQYTDLWILTVPSFTWIKVDIEKDGQPPARAGHTCHARDGQMIVVGGYIGQTNNCDGAGIYNFNASSLKWQDQFGAADHPADISPDNTILADSYGYRVPDIVQSVIGGHSDGGATATHPASGPATGGPFATGKPPVFTVTASGGSTATVTSSPNGSSNGSNNGASSGPKGGLIAAGVIAGVLGALALYLGFCAWLYRRQVAAYKKHMLAANRYSGTVIPEDGGDGVDHGYDHDFNNTTYGGAGAALAGTGGGAAAIKEKLRKNRRPGGSSSGESGAAREQFGWVGQRPDNSANQPFLSEPKWLSEDPSPGASSSAAAGTSSSRKYSSSDKAPRPSEDRNPWGWFESPSSGGGGGVSRNKSSATRSTASGNSTEGLLDGREPNFFSVVLGPRRALRVVNGMEE
ncbi:hypothetical protein PG989_015180 [Apiospora arundinis]